MDIYVRELDQRDDHARLPGRRLLRGACGNGAFDASFVPGSTPNGEGLLRHRRGSRAADEDGSSDVYMRDLAAGTTALVSAPRSAGRVAATATSRRLQRRLHRRGEGLLHRPSSLLAEADGDEPRTSTSATSAAKPPSSSRLPGPARLGRPQCGFGGASSDGSQVFFETNEQLSGADSDDAQDVYDWSAGAGRWSSRRSRGRGKGAGNASFAGGLRRLGGLLRNRRTARPR